MTDSQSLDLTELLSNISQDPSITDTLAYINGLEEDSTPDDSPAISIIDTLICNNQPDEVLNSLELHPFANFPCWNRWKNIMKTCMFNLPVCRN